MLKVCSNLWKAVFLDIIAEVQEKNMKYLGDENISYSWNFQSWGSILNSNIIHIKDNFAKLETSGQNQSEMQKLGWFWPELIFVKISQIIFVEKKLSCGEILGNFGKFWEILGHFATIYALSCGAQKYTCGEKMTNMRSGFYLRLYQ